MRAIWDDRAMIQRWLDVEAALAAVEAELGLVPKAAAREIARKARVELLDLRAMKRDFDLTWNPVMPLVDALRRVLSPAAGRWVHWGATSKNIMDTGTRAADPRQLRGRARGAGRDLPTSWPAWRAGTGTR